MINGGGASGVNGTFSGGGGGAGGTVRRAVVSGNPNMSADGEQQEEWDRQKMQQVMTV